MSTPGIRPETQTDFDTVLRAYREPLRRFFARRLRDVSEAEDLIQDVFCRMVHRGGLAGIAQVEAYIFQTAHNVLRDHIRRRATHSVAQHDSEYVELPDEDASPERVLMGKEAIGEFARALSELPERTRVIFIQSRINLLDYKEISILQGISVSAVEKHIAKALAHLVLRVKV